LRLHHLLPGCKQRSAGALGEPLRADAGEHGLGWSQLHMCVDASTVATQPLPVEQTGAGEFRTEPSAAETFDRFTIPLVSRRPIAQERPAASLDAEGELGADGLDRLRQPIEHIRPRPRCGWPGKRGSEIVGSDRASL
jgi:hypothetical protein